MVSMALVAKKRATNPITEIVEAMERAAGLGIEGALAIKAINAKFGVERMTDHYRSGIFENIQMGLDGDRPELKSVRVGAPIAPEEREADVGNS